MNLKNYLLAILIMLSPVLFAQNASNKNALGLYVTKAEYRGDVGSGLFKFGKDYKFNLGGAVSYQRYLLPSLDWGLQGSFGEYSFTNPNPTPQQMPFTGRKYDAITYINYKLNNGYLLNEESVIAPFLSVGIGGAGYYSGNINKNPMFDLIAPVGGGIKFRFSDVVGLEYKYLLNFTNRDTRDNLALPDSRIDVFGQHFVGLVFSFGGKDSDRDGVKDHKDLCPDTPIGVTVDVNGCPIDSDGDGVPDYLDECPNVPGLEELQGCPDADGDGIPDSKDLCPNTPKGVAVDASGCPIDTDGDGVPDYLDKCPNAKGLPEHDGCPDTDGDGIPDYLDKCPDVPGLAKFDGCPDTDGDGIPDHLDRCPDLPGIPENKGCPPVQEETKKLFTEALQGIQFDIDKATIKPTSFSILDRVVKVMNDNSAYNLEINGHTDSTGPDDHNQDLSERRAASVKQYLTDKGIDASRLTSRGFGESQPVAPNTTANGRYKNRRVEFKVIF